MTGLKEFVNLDAVSGFQSRDMCKFDVRLNSDAGDNPVHLNAPPALGHDSQSPTATLYTGRRFTGQDIDTLLAVKAVQELRKVTSIDAVANALVGEEHSYLTTVHRQRCRDFPTDESAPYDSEPLTLVGEPA